MPWIVPPQGPGQMNRIGDLRSQSSVRIVTPWAANIAATSGMDSRACTGLMFSLVDLLTRGRCRRFARMRRC